MKINYHKKRQYFTNNIKNGFKFLDPALVSVHFIINICTLCIVNISSCCMDAQESLKNYESHNQFIQPIL